MQSVKLNAAARCGRLAWVCGFLALGAAGLIAQVTPIPLGPPPVPPENPLTAEKALLGKFLFWDEQLSADDTVACGSCHAMTAGGADARAFSPLSRHPGADLLFGTGDDALGSIGIVRHDCGGATIDDGVFHPDRQVTRRNASSVIASAYDPEVFWNGAAGEVFINPITGQTLIPAGGALENQALTPILSAAEMSCVGRTWSDVEQKLATVTPLALGSDLPVDLAAARAAGLDYPDMFALAFGDSEITPARIAFAIASYERTLVPDQTPFDLFLGGQSDALSDEQVVGMLFFIDLCAGCHGGATLNDGDYHNIGVRPSFDDVGRMEVTLQFDDRGKFKTPSLRNVGLTAPYFHNGGKSTLMEVVEFYDIGGEFDDHLDPEMFVLDLLDEDKVRLVDFLTFGLTDPRVAALAPPFDQPCLRAYFRRGDANFDGTVDISDAIRLLDYLFLAGAAVACADAADSNDDGALNLADAVSVLARLFQSAPPLPLPGDDSFGPDPTLDGLDCLR
ncbi:MAG: cytochrome c peroxidase [Planctomycetota bacterium]